MLRCYEETHLDTGEGRRVEFLVGVLLYKYVFYLIHDSDMIKLSA